MLNDVRTHTSMSKQLIRPKNSKGSLKVLPKGIEDDAPPTSGDYHDKSGKFFDNLPRLMRPEQAAAYLSVTIATIYDWRYRGCLRGVPKELFLSLNRRLYIRTDVLLNWIASQNPEGCLG